MNFNYSSDNREIPDVPKELKKWNWGAFWLTWIWGIFNGVYIALLALIPILNFIIPFYLGKKGGELVWTKTSWKGIEEIKLIQRKWAIGGWIFAIFMYSIAGIRIADTYRMEKINASITDKVMIELKKNEEIKKLVGDEYTFIFKPALGTVNAGNRNIPMDQIIYLKGIDGPVMVYTSLDKNCNIEIIRVSPPNGGNDIYIDIPKS